ncbi:hypothetical protein [Streptomyces sp. NPDC094472]|uniref:hypothetical protein n=1 Tax=unclassified Streptomyces TaxID=2593676 RepID=UPI00331C647F
MFLRETQGFATVCDRPRPKKVRRLVEWVDNPVKDHLGLRQHGARTIEGVAVGAAQRVLTLAAAVWRDFRTGQAISRSPTAYDR